MQSGVPGNVGIGTSVPSAKLEVAGDIKSRGDIQADGQVCDGNGDCIGDASSSLWSASGGNTYITSGNVGVGTASPSSKLDVRGNIKASGSICDGAGRCIGDNNGGGGPAGQSCPSFAYVGGFNSSGGLICHCLPGYLYNGSACAVPAPGLYRYLVNPYGGCAGAGMDVHLERRYSARGWEYKVSYKFRSDYAWQSSFTITPWFFSTSRFNWAHGRDNPWFEVALSNGNVTFRRGDCKGGTTSRWGYAEWPLTDANFQ